MGIEASNHSDSVASGWSEPLRSRNCTPRPVLAAYRCSTATVRAFLALLFAENDGISDAASAPGGDLKSTRQHAGSGVSVDASSESSRLKTTGLDTGCADAR
jgi:hypothetical protein